MKEKETQVSVEAVRCSYLDFERLAHMFSEKIRKEGLLNEMRSDDSLARTLFLCVLVNLLPVVFASSFVKGFHRTSLYSIVVGAAFATQCLILLRFFSSAMFESNQKNSCCLGLFCTIFADPAYVSPITRDFESVRSDKRCRTFYKRIAAVRFSL